MTEVSFKASRKPSYVKAPSVRAALDKALQGDSKVTVDDVESILQAMFKNHRVTVQEWLDLISIAENAPCTTEAIVAIYQIHEKFVYLARRPWSFARLKHYFGHGIVPQGWRGSAYDTGGAGACAVKLSRALKLGGFLSLKDFPSSKNDNGRHVWPRPFAPDGLPVNARELAEYLWIKLGPGQNIDVHDPTTLFRQGIIYIDGFDDASGHITLYDGNKDRFEDGLWFKQAEVPTLTVFWDMRPTWLVW